MRLIDTIDHSFGTFLTRGVLFELVGDGNNVGKSLSDGRIVICPPKDTKIVTEETIIVGNTLLYCAIEVRVVLLPRRG